MGAVLVTMKGKDVSVGDVHTGVPNLLSALKDTKLYRDFHAQVGDQQLSIGQWNNECRQTSFSTEIEGTMARVALGASRVTIRERTKIHPYSSGAEVISKISFAGCAKLSTVEATVTTRCAGTATGCHLSGRIEVHNKNTAEKFVEAGLLKALEKGLRKWGTTAKKFAEHVQARVSAPVSAVAPPPAVRLLSTEGCSANTTLGSFAKHTKEQRLALEAQLMQDMVQTARTQRHHGVRRFDSHRHQPISGVRPQARLGMQMMTQRRQARQQIRARTAQPIDRLHATIMQCV